MAVAWGAKEAMESATAQVTAADVAARGVAMAVAVRSQGRALAEVVVARLEDHREVAGAVARAVVETASLRVEEGKAGEPKAA